MTVEGHSLLRASSNGIFRTIFAVVDKIFTDTACLHGPSAVAEFLVDWGVLETFTIAFTRCRPMDSHSRAYFSGAAVWAY